MLESLDLSSYNNLQTLRIHPGIISPAALRAIFNTISSKHLENLIIGPTTGGLSQPLEQFDQVFCSIKKRLHERGAVNPLKITVITLGTEVGELDLWCLAAVFCAGRSLAGEVSLIVEALKRQ